MSTPKNNDDNGKRKRRARGDGGLSWNEDRQRWIAEATIGYTAAGRRIVRKGSGTTITEAKAKLKKILSDHEAGLTLAPGRYSVAQAVEDWYRYNLPGRSASTRASIRINIDTHVIPSIGARQAAELSPEDVEQWLEAKAKYLSDNTIMKLVSILRRSMNRAMARGRVQRNVVLLVETPKGTGKRKAKALTHEQANRLLKSADKSRYRVFIKVSLLTGARSEELRPLEWDMVDLGGKPDECPPVPPSVSFWISVRESGDTKTQKSRRTQALAQLAVQELRAHRQAQIDARERAERRALRPSHPQRRRDYQANNLVFPTVNGTVMDARSVRRAFRLVLADAGLDPDLRPRELRHSFVSLLSAAGTQIEDIARLVGHSSTAVTETVYRQQIQPVMEKGAIAMDKLFPVDN